MTTLAAVELWGRRIGAVSLADGADVASFEYDPDFLTSGIQLAPLAMPLRPGIFSFPALSRETFKGLPGLLSDSLPDKFGNALIDVWLARQGRLPRSFNAVERLCYTGKRGMGALEFTPAIGPNPASSRKVDIDELVKLASDILANRSDLNASFTLAKRNKALLDILQVGTSAGGARAKAVIAWNETTNEVRSGQVDAGKGFGYWLLKFDGVAKNRDRELADPQGFTVIEYAYSQMAIAAGIGMSECRLLEENGRRHFMTRRFDRTPNGDKLHMQSLCAMAHFDFNLAGAYGYEQCFLVMRQLGLPMAAIEEQFRRTAFNILARNQDDHVKNIAFLMDRTGAWSLSPAFDLAYSYNPAGAWTAQHQMSMNGKRDGFTLDDFRACGKAALLKRGRAEAIVNEVAEAVARWPQFADDAGVAAALRDTITPALRLDIR
ncbi:MAG: HipA domain-containing protein [Hyphomonadaceae bacterium]|nr:HipA domain-containing protein [Hyphomonadaceae bacterium]